MIQKFTAWLTVAHGVPFPVHWKQLTEHAQVRVSEPCMRGSFKLLLSSFLFLQEISGVQDKFTEEALYEVARKEFWASALPVKPPRQAPRFTTLVLAVLEDNVVSLDSLVYWRVLSWWLLLQCWATLRFDHRESGLVGRLITGPDKKLTFRLLVVDTSSFVHQRNWLLTGLQLLEKGAP